MLVNIEDASRLMRYPAGNITGWRLWLDEPLKVDSLSQQKLPEGSKWQDWRDRKGELFRPYAWKKYDGLLLSLIVAVAAFNIITSLGLMVMEKQAKWPFFRLRADSAANHDGLYGAGPAPGLSVRSSERRLAHCLPAS